MPHTIRCLGVSNFSLSQLRELYDAATVKPSFVLRHNPGVLESEVLASVADRLHVEKELAFYLLILGLGGTQVLDGTTKPERMLRDVKTVAEVMDNEALLGELQPDIDEFRKLLKQLTG